MEGDRNNEERKRGSTRGKEGRNEGGKREREAKLNLSDKVKKD